ncbi:MAG: hypothetical protein NTV70_19400 [Acidobacteria bacterium]|nr:hypothetical protein [Acidobacteriota bacterium]
MSSSLNPNISFSQLRNLPWRDPKVLMRAVLGGLVLANLIALWMVVMPPGGSAADLDAQLITLRSQFNQRKLTLDRARAFAAKVDKGRKEADKFQTEYFTDRRVASSTFVAELAMAAKDVGIKPKEHTFVFDPVEGSDTLSMMTITANYEGTYADLVHFVNRLDRSSRFLILDSLAAAPQQQGGILMITFKLNAFVREARL